MKTLTTITTAVLLSGTAPAFAADAPGTWDASASAGFTLTRGNSESVLANVGLKAETKWDQNEVKLGLDGLYGKTKVDGEPETKSAETLVGFGQYNRLLTEELYGYMRLEALHDGVAGIKYRLTASPGVGYYFIKTPKTELNAEAGPSFIFEKTTDGEKNYIALRLAENFKHSLNDHVRIWQKAEFLPQIDDLENYIFNFEAGIEADLTERLSFQSKVLNTYDNQPASGRKHNDLKWINAISYKF
jgi:putative salt-induced outer membrane protein YdiY